MADLDEARRQDVQEEAPHEFDSIDGGYLAVLRAEANVVSVEADQTLVRESDPVGVAAEILEDLLGPAEGRLGIDDPILPVQLVLGISSPLHVLTDGEKCA